MPSRREFLFSLGVAALPLGRALSPSPFKLSVITDEISQDLGACLRDRVTRIRPGWVELRAMHDKNVINWNAQDIAEAQSILKKFNLRVSEIASPIFKTDWPGAPKSPYSPKKPEFGASDFTFEQQDELLDRAFALAKAFDNPPDSHFRLLAARRSEAAPRWPSTIA